MFIYCRAKLSLALAIDSGTNHSGCRFGSSARTRSAATSMNFACCRVREPKPPLPDRLERIGRRRLRAERSVTDGLNGHEQRAGDQCETDGAAIFDDQ